MGSKKHTLLLQRHGCPILVSCNWFYSNSKLGTGEKQRWFKVCHKQSLSNYFSQGKVFMEVFLQW